MSRSHTKAEVRKLVISELEVLIDRRSNLLTREGKEITHEITRLKERLEKDVRSLVNNRDYAVKGQAQ
jgi:ElaB/YqjD/DUF883 family membrane-anchored ribosome-binding protein